MKNINIDLISLRLNSILEKNKVVENEILDLLNFINSNVKKEDKETAVVDNDNHKEVLNKNEEEMISNLYSNLLSLKEKLNQVIENS